MKHLIRLILCENDVKFLKFKRSPVKVNLLYVWSVGFWLYTPESDESDGVVNLFFYRKFNLECLLFKK